MITEIQAKSILRKHKKIDSWFLSHYGINLYRGCRHNCVYCDGRAEMYYVPGDFGSDIVVKTNAAELLEKELNPARKRKPMPKSFIMLGGGVCDAYQPAEKKYQLARRTLELCLRFNHPVHILTKSTLVERDLDLLLQINKKNKAMVSFSLSSTDEKLSAVFEPGVPPPAEKLKTIRRFTQKGIQCGVYLMPVIPFITDTTQQLKQTLTKVRDAGASFAIFGSMTLKPGRQKEYFIQKINEEYPELLPEYDMLYAKNSNWGEPEQEYLISIHEVFNKIASHLNIPKRIPLRIYKSVLSTTDTIIVVLEHLDYLLKLRNEKSPFGYAAYQLSKLDVPLEEMLPGELYKIQGVGQRTFNIIRELQTTGKCRLYENLMK